MSLINIMRVASYVSLFVMVVVGITMIQEAFQGKLSPWMTMALVVSTYVQGITYGYIWRERQRWTWLP